MTRFKVNEPVVKSFFYNLNGNDLPFAINYIMAVLSLFFIIDNILKLIWIKLQQYDDPLNKVQSKSLYFLHIKSHPSPLIKFPSSHYASITIPSPQIYSHISVIKFIWYPILHPHW